ncbi:hypothetical protein [Nitrosospira sp. NpAV]|uniref:hypothetical protein n=1 Tax=Nitrosospira sp. NpAV TaxID=58133 RepID=UPI0005A16632|nr:hypothetical protein [Nitrosospira sp. NpAV]KIO49086.1 hypothetical protein SQ11_08120 [Nitrosospira sp. NpAV]
MATILGTKDIVTILSLFGLLAACALMTANVKGENIAGQAAIQGAMASSESQHTILAKSHEDKAKALWVKAQEQKQLLEHYEEKSYLYGKRAQDLQSSTWALIRNYEGAAMANMKEAVAHRRIASELEKNSGLASRPQKIEGFNSEI